MTGAGVDPQEFPALTQRGTLGQVLPTVAQHLGLRADDQPRLVDIPRTQRYVVMVVDGLGVHQLHAHPGLAPFLTRSMVGSLRSALPSTTAANLTYFGTGLMPGRTGMLGYSVRHPTLRTALNLVSWNLDIDPVRWQSHPTVFEQLSASGHQVVSVGPWKFEGSGLTTAALRGAEYEAAESLAQRCERTSAILMEEPEVPLIYTYWGDLDSTGHSLGWRSSEWRDRLGELDHHLEKLAGELDADTTLIVTADHGMVDVPLGASAVFSGPARIDVADHTELSTQVEFKSGEDRFVHLHVETGAAATVARRWAGFFGERARVMQREEAISAGVFGEVEPRWERVIGDVVALMQGDLACQDSRRQSPGSLGLIGMHGSDTEAEVQVPLIVA